MIRIVRSIFVRPADGSSEWAALPVVPTTATLDIETSHEDEGRLTTYDLTATLRFLPKVVYDDVQVRVIFDDNTTEAFGTPDGPVRVSTSHTDVCTIECSYEY